MKTYKYSELPENIKQKFIEDYGTTHDDWHDDVIHDFIEDMMKYGIFLCFENIQYTGFHSQGDGASFTVSSTNVNVLDFINNSCFDFDMERQKYEDLRNLCDALSEPLPENIYEKIATDYISLYVDRTSHHYCHSGTVDAKLEDSAPHTEELSEEFLYETDCDTKVENFVNKLTNHWKSFIKEKCDELYSRLYKDYLSRTDSVVIESYLSEKTFEKVNNNYYEIC